MEYIKHIQDGYILSVQTNAPKGMGNCAKDDYDAIMAAIKSAPVPPDGYGYRLTESLAWELYELPAETVVDEEATAEDYQAALAEMGVDLDGD